MVGEHYGRPNTSISRMIRRKARSLSRHPGFSKTDIEDLQQELWAHLLERQAHYNPALASFETFADRLISNRACSILRHRRRHKRHPKFESISLNGVIEGDGGEVQAVYETIESPSSPRPDARDLIEDVQTLIAQLDVPDRLVVIAHLDGLSKQAIRRHLGISRRQLDRSLNRIREAAQRMDLIDYF